MCCVLRLQHPPSAVYLNVVELSGSPMLALTAHVHTTLSSPKSCLSEGRKQQWGQRRQPQQVSTPHVRWQVLPCGHFPNCQAFFISTERAKSWCQPYGDFVKAIDLVFHRAQGSQIHYISVCSSGHRSFSWKWSAAQGSFNIQPNYLIIICRKHHTCHM